jgi:hypothetical protein
LLQKLRFVNQICKEGVPGLHVLLLPQADLFELVLGFEVGGIRFLHVLVNAIQTLFILLHAVSQVFFHLPMVCKHSRIVDLSTLFKLFSHLLLNVDYLVVTVPNILLLTAVDAVGVLTPD